jgi:ABC-type multidrug transport system fused ATPase/permease subunit
MDIYSATTKPDMTWLIGRTIKEVGKQDYTWSFIFDDGSSIGTESYWRLVTARGIVVTSEDDGHPFGLPAPVSAAERVTQTVAESPIEQFDLSDRTSDLVLHFANDATIEFLNLSCGYEGWNSIHGHHRVICMGGGGFTEFSGYGIEKNLGAEEDRPEVLSP